MAETLIAPHGGTLVSLLAAGARAVALEGEAAGLPAWTLTPRQACDFELLVTGGFSPLRGFLGRPDWESVCARLRLADGTLWPIPVTLDVSEEAAGALRPGGRLALRDAGGTLLGIQAVTDVWRPDREAEARAVFGTTDPGHPGAAAMVQKSHPVYVGGSVEAVRVPAHDDFGDLRLTPAQARVEFSRRGWGRIVAFQTRNPLHRAHVELTLRAAKSAQAHLLIHPVVGMTKPGDVDHVTRVHCYQALLPHYPPATTMLALLPLAMRMGGPREAVWHAIIRKNHGCTHFIVGRDHAGPGKDAAGKPYYGPYDAQELLRQHEKELGVAMVEFKMMVYVEALDQYFPDDEVPAGQTTVAISGTELRQMLKEGREIPRWFTYPEVAEVLRANPNPPV